MENLSPYATPIVIVIIAIIGGVVGLIQWGANVNADRKTFREFMEEVKNDIKELLRRLPPVTTTGESPIELTDLGKKVVTMLQPDQWIEKYASQRLPCTVSMSLYQIQKDAFEFAEQELLIQIQKDAPDLVKTIENCAFHHGISVSEVMKALGVVLRDKIFVLKGLSIQDV
ncbi:MAG: hypothetical protein OXF39_01645 [Nitrospira sp.]|nr:hypothetical protein [Nitrospira sp.]